MYYSSFIHLPIEGHLSCLSLGAVINKAAKKKLCTAIYMNTSCLYSKEKT